MSLGVHVPVIMSLRSNIDKLTSKRQLKGWKPELTAVLQ